MRAVTVLDCETVEIDSDDLLMRRLYKSVEQTALCHCGKRSTEFITVSEYGFGGDPAYGSFRSARCDDHGAAILVPHPQFKGMKVVVEMLGQRHWLTYKDGILVHESRGA